MSAIRDCADMDAKELKTINGVPPLRLVSENDVAKIICKYEQSAKQKTMIYELSMLTGCLATEEQLLEILGNQKLELED